MSASRVFHSKLRFFAAQTLALIRADAGIYLLIAFYALAGLLFLDMIDASDRASYAVYLHNRSALFGLVMPVIAILADAVWIVHRFDRRRGLAARRMFGPSRLAHLVSGICLLMAFTVFLGTFTSVKNGLSVWQDGFPFDRVQADIDAALHFGVDPWRWLFAAMKNDIVRIVIEWNYGAPFFFICFGVLFVVVTSPRTAHIRTRYLICFLLVWIVVGNVLAGLFMSAGPAFYGSVTGDTLRFAEQLQFLARDIGVSNATASYQALLWKLHSSGQTGFASGISALPSMHVALVVFIALFAWEHSRWLGIVASVYAVVIAVSSVYLAWHYAIDGYVAAAVTSLIYVLGRKAFAIDRPQGDRKGAPRTEIPGLAVTVS